MDFDFYEQFRVYSTVELIKIIRQRDQYQGAAIAAAQRLLREREVFPADEEQADRYFREKEAERIVREVQLNFYKDKVTDFVEPVIRPMAEVHPQKWYRLFVVVYGIYYAWSFYTFVRSELYLLDCSDCRPDGPIFLEWINIAYQSIAFFLLIRKNRWGWILLIAVNIFEVTTYTGELYFLYKYRDVVRFNATAVFFGLLYPVALAVFLWRRPIAEFFDVDDVVKKRTAGVALLLGVGLSVWAMTR